MGAFLDWFFEFMTTMLKDGVLRIFTGIFWGIVQIFNIPDYISIFNSHSSGFSAIEWVLSIFAMIVIFLIWALLITLAVFGLRKYFRFRRSIVGNEDLLEELADMHRDVLRLTKEKERIMALKIGQTSISVDELNAILNPDEEGNASIEEARAAGLAGAAGGAGGGEGTGDGSGEGTTAVASNRFFRLSAVDEKYRFYVEPEYDRSMSLSEICDDFRNFACSKMHLYYEIRTIRLMFAGLASTKMILLQGISGTGKTSLPYSMGKYFKNDATIASVQPSWRDRTELFGYFNEFTKKFNETEFLRRIYEASYNDDINVIVLDEMNIARVEYYFAEMLSVLEMPDPNEWKLELVPSSWPDDPIHLKDGKLQIPQNVWYVGTANNDDSTFAVSDKVYDRALVINLDTKGVPFEAPETEPKRISYKYIEGLYQKAFKDHPVSQKILDDISKLDLYVIEHFRVAFGNRIMKQMLLFVPAYVACGGTELDGIDYVLATKVFRKFEGLNLSLIRDEIRGLIAYLDAVFGRGQMHECITYLERLQKMF